ncbi:MAG: ribonuclease HII [Anaerolineae bacterium]|nr:ribonuclease HII [Anaerolineae bacterium]
MHTTGPSKTRPSLDAEARFWAQGLRYVAGLDEVGRGPWAGPVYAAAVILPALPDGLAAMEGVRDSKMLSEAQRVRLTTAILATAVAAAIGRAEAAEIDALGIVPATRLAMRRALAALAVTPEALVIDALTLPGVALPQDAFPYADARSLSVAAASILAKTRRDAWMATVAEAQFPGYGFAQHKGYGTRRHREALARLGVTPLHRRSFRPIAEFADAGHPDDQQEKAPAQ